MPFYSAGELDEQASCGCITTTNIVRIQMCLNLNWSGLHIIPVLLFSAICVTREQRSIPCHTVKPVTYWSNWCKTIFSLKYFFNKDNLTDLIAAVGFLMLPKSDQNHRVSVLKSDAWPWKTMEHLFSSSLNSVRHWKAIGEFKLESQFGNP